MLIRIVTYSSMPRGDVVHATSLAGALAARGHHVELWALDQAGAPPPRDVGVPNVLVAGEPDGDGPPAGAMRRNVVALADGLAGAGRTADITHAEDPLSALALLHLRERGQIPEVVRTIHHVDAFPNQELLEWQRSSIVDVDHRICVSRHWAERVEQEFGVTANVVANGVDAERFAGCELTRQAAAGAMGWGSRTVVLAVGGIEPRKGSRLLLEAFARARARLGERALLAMVGGEAMFDAPDYREAWWRDANRLGLMVHDLTAGPVPDEADVVITGAVAEDLMPTVYRAADVLAFPSTREGFGLVVLEAIASGIPAVVADLPVLREHLRDGRDCLVVPAGDSGLFANAIVGAVRDEALRDRLRVGGAETVARFTWDACATGHEATYERILRQATQRRPS